MGRRRLFDKSIARVGFSHGMYVELMFAGDLFDLNTSERELIHVLSDAVQKFKAANQQAEIEKEKEKNGTPER